ncbi:type VI secretion system lipoprotein TssJ [Enterobacter quasihormaechei]|uniref:Type VI secretion system lipoprotein TssJ n=1 Tax=Enterobacter quasihormaechei TaxID=2529382 RepID=A0ABU9PK91_9ENTR
MAITTGNTRMMLLALTLATTLTGCGLSQTVKDGTVSVAKSIFYKQVKTLHLDIQARSGVNNNANGASLATVVRVYQLKDRKAFDSTDYPSLFADDSQAIKADLVAEKDIRLRPGESVTLDMPLDEIAEYVAVAAMFMAPDQTNDAWRLVLAREDLDPDSPRIIEASNNRLTLQARKED